MNLELIKTLRKEKKFSLQKVSDLSGVSTVYIGELERGAKIHPSAEKLDAIAHALGISITVFLEDKPDKSAWKWGFD